MSKIAIKSIGKTFSIDKIGDNDWNVNFDQTKSLLFADIATNRKKKQFYKRTTLLSLYAIKEALVNANIDLKNCDMSRVALYSFEKESNNINIEDTYHKLIKFCQLQREVNGNFCEVFSKCYSLSDLFRIMPNLSNHLISAELGIKGANKTILTGEGADLQSIIDASIDINENKFDMVICGSSTSNYSILEKKQMAKFYNLDLSKKEIKESSIYVIIGKDDSNSSLYVEGGKSFYMKSDLIFLKQKEYIENLFNDFFISSNSTTKDKIDLVLYLDQYNKASTFLESKVFKDVFKRARFIIPNLDNNHNICNGLYYLSLLHNKIYDFEKALLIQKNYNNIITFILITK